LATVTINVNGVSVNGAINIVSSYPNLFTMNHDGLAAAYVIRVRGGVVTSEDVYQSTSNGLEARPIDPGPPTDEVYLILFGSGLGSGNPTVTARVDDQESSVAFAGPQSVYPGLDQYNIRLPATLSGRGRVPVVITVGGRPANTVFVAIK
jgi:uncharacterized protein (TIGR03437 family)